MGWLLRFALALLLCGVAAIAALAARPALQALAQAWPAQWPVLLAVAAGGVIGCWRGATGFYRTLEHELTHVLFALLCLRSPRHIVVTDRRGGEAAFSGEANFLISLAPYFFPLTAVVLAGLIGLAAAPWRTWLARGLIVALGYHLAVILGELRIGQTDVSRHGTVFSLLMIAALAVPIMLVLFFFALGGTDGVADYGRAWIATLHEVTRGIRFPR